MNVNTAGGVVHLAEASAWVGAGQDVQPEAPSYAGLHEPYVSRRGGTGFSYTMEPAGKPVARLAAGKF